MSFIDKLGVYIASPYQTQYDTSDGSEQVHFYKQHFVRFEVQIIKVAFVRIVGCRLLLIKIVEQLALHLVSAHKCSFPLVTIKKKQVSIYIATAFCFGTILTSKTL
jgi:hypothetical protein